MTDAVVQLKILDPTPANAAQATRGPRGVAPPGPAHRRESPIAAAAAGRYSPPLPRARGRLSRLHAAQPAAGGIDRKTILRRARRPAGPDPGGKSGPDAGGRQVRPRPGTPFLDVCLLVDPADDPPRAGAAPQRLPDVLRDDPEARQDPACQATAPANPRGRALHRRPGRCRGNRRPRNGEPAPHSAASAIDRRVGHERPIAVARRTGCRSSPGMPQRAPRSRQPGAADGGDPRQSRHSRAAGIADALRPAGPASR